MNRINSFFLIIAASMVFCATSVAQVDPEKAALQREIQELKKQQAESQAAFEKRLKALEDRMAAKESAKSEPTPVKMEGLVQLRYDVDSMAPDSFFLRRTELKFSGKVAPNIGWTVMVDLAKQLKLTTAPAVDQASRILQDAYVTIGIGGPYSLEAGQKRIPFSSEGTISGGLLDTLERALFLALGKLGDARDIGVHFKGKWPEAEATMAVLNGAGETLNQRDTSDNKTFAARALWTPKSAKGLAVGGSALTGNGPDKLLRERWGADARFDRGPFSVRGEYANSIMGGGRQEGWFGHVGYKFNSTWEAIARLDSWDPSLLTGGDRETDTVLGFNHYINGQAAKLQLNYVQKDFEAARTRRVWQLGLQTRW